jgi:hypothetical protein
MSKNYTLTGIGSNYEIGPSGPRLKNTSGFIEARDSVDTAFTNVRGADAVILDDLVTLRQLQNFSVGLSWKNPARAATDVSINIASAPPSIDGVTLVAGDRILVKDQAAPAENGIYVFASAGNPLTRAADLPVGSNATNVALFVSEGTTQADTAWVQSADPATRVGTDPLTFTEFASIVPGIQDIDNVGGGAQILQGIVSGLASLRTLTSTDASVSISTVGDTVNLSVPAAAPAVNFRSLVLNFTDYGATPINIGTVLPANAHVLEVSVYVNNSFDNGATVQINAGPTIILDAINSNLSTGDETFIGTDQVAASGAQLTASLNAVAPSVGQATIVVRFVVLA